MPEAAQALHSLRKLLTAAREDRKEELAAGRPPEEMQRLVGHCKGLKYAIDKISEQIKSIGEEDDDTTPK